MEAALYHLVEVTREMRRDTIVVAFHDLGGEALHALSSERREKRYHFVKNAAQGPDVAQVVVGLFLPDLGTCVVGSACLRLKEASLGNLRHVEVAELDHTVLGDEKIGALDVPMDYFQIMKCLKASDNLNKVVPDLLLSEFSPLFFVFLDALK